MVRLRRLLLLTALVCLPGAALAEGTQALAAPTIAPFIGTWRINFELSYLRALADEHLPQRDPATLRNYVDTMSQIIELSIGDSLITYSRGRHTKSFPYAITGEEDGKLQLTADPQGQSADWVLELTTEGYLYLRSSATQVTDFYVYERGHILRDENGLPAFLSKPPQVPGEWTAPPPAPSDSAAPQAAPPRG
jgi:hypothetical protein